jgi:hypothetical protein
MATYPGKFTGGRVKKPLDELMQPSGDQKKVTYDEGLRWVEGTKNFGLDVEKADRVRFNAEKLRTKTHGRRPSDDDQA